MSEIITGASCVLDLTVTVRVDKIDSDTYGFKIDSVNGPLWVDSHYTLAYDADGNETDDDGDGVVNELVDRITNHYPEGPDGALLLTQAVLRWLADRS